MFVEDSCRLSEGGRQILPRAGTADRSARSELLGREDKLVVSCRKEPEGRCQLSVVEGHSAALIGQFVSSWWVVVRKPLNRRSLG